jgi:hypothetical protein
VNAFYATTPPCRPEHQPARAATQGHNPQRGSSSDLHQPHLAGRLHAHMAHGCESLDAHVADLV